MKFVFVLILPFIFNPLFAQRTMYVNDFETIIDNDEDKTRLLSYAQSNQFDYLILYDLHTVHTQYDLTNSATNQILVDFISDAKNNYGITRIGAATENAWFIENRIIAYNNTCSYAHEKFDIMVMEYEFWSSPLTSPGGYYCNTYLAPNGFVCDSNGAYQFCINELQTMKNLALASSHPMTVEMYVGWPSATQLHGIADVVDRTMIHAYVTDPNTAFAYAETRFVNYNSYVDEADIGIIYSAEPNFSGPWMANNSINLAEAIFINDYNSSAGAWKANVNFDGFVYFAYSYLLCDIGLNDFNGIVDNDEIHKVSSSLSSSAELVNDVAVSYNSETDITLLQGFLIELGSSLQADIQPCD